MKSMLKASDVNTANTINRKGLKMSKITEIVSKQKEYFLTGATRPYQARLANLKKLEKSVKTHEAELLDALKQDLNKSDYESYLTEIGIALEEIRYHKKHLKKWMKKKKISSSLSHFPSKGYSMPEPYGVVLIASPWNYPLNMCFQALLGAISAGNCAVIKPSAYAAATSKAIVRLISDTFDPEYVTVVEGGRAENQELFKQKFDYIFFTGSVSVGKTVMKEASENLVPVTLELGGKSPVIIDETADLKHTAKRVAFGKILNAGQTCIAPDYVLIKDSVRDDFIKEFSKAVEEFFKEEDISTMPVIINEKHFNRLSNLLTQGTLKVGGKTDPERRFIEPTLLTDVSPESELMTDEIFGPILPVLTYSTLDECIGFILSRPKPLALYLFTKDKNTINRVMGSCSFGGGCVNDVIVHVSSATMPFGGVGNSGMGSYHGRQSFETFTHRRSVLVNKSRFEMFLRYHPYKPVKYKILRRYLGHEK